MGNLSTQSLFNLALWLAIAGGLTGLAAFVLKNVREHSLHHTDDVSDANAQLTQFREMKAQGQLSDEEFRSIKTKLQGQLLEELSDSKEGA